MANLPEKNITTVDKVTSIPSNTNLYINANGEFRQATVDDVLKASPVIADSIANQYKNASGSPILLTDSAKGVAIEFNAKGRSTQDGEPTPTEPITPKSNGDMGYFDGELLQGAYSGSSGAWGSTSTYVCNKNIIPCKAGDTIKLEYAEETSQLMILYYDSNKNFISYSSLLSVSELEVNAVENACYFNININNADGITPQTAKHICVTINDKYALIVDSKGKNKFNVANIPNLTGLTNNNGVLTITNNYTILVAIPLSELADLVVGETYILSFKTTGANNFIYIRGSQTQWQNGTALTITQAMLDGGINLYGATDTTVTISDIQIRPLGTDATYEPYKKSRKYIPISAPLRGLGEVTDVLNLSGCKVTRRFASITYDGNSGISMGSSLKYFYSPEISNAKPLSIKLISTHYKNNGGINLNYGNIYIDELSRIVFADNRFSTASEVKEWLAENPITVIYELAEPTTESIEPIDVDTFEGVTHISVSDNADMEVEYPTSKVAGIASIGWSKGRRAEYDLEQLKAQMLALQTTIVSTV